MSGYCDFCQIWHSGSCCHPARFTGAATYTLDTITITQAQLVEYGNEREAYGRATYWTNPKTELEIGMAHVKLARQAAAERDAAMARVAELESLLRMLVTRARNFPDFPMGWHMPEVFKAVGMQMPERPP